MALPRYSMMMLDSTRYGPVHHHRHPLERPDAACSAGSARGPCASMQNSKGCRSRMLRSAPVAVRREGMRIDLHGEWLSFEDVTDREG